MTFLETLRRGGSPILDRGTMAMASTNQVGTLREQDEPGWGFGLLSGSCSTPSRLGGRRTRERSGGEASGVTRGSSTPWPDITVVMLSNTALEGCTGSAFPQDVAEAIYASGQNAGS